MSTKMNYSIKDLTGDQAVIVPMTDEELTSASGAGVDVDPWAIGQDIGNQLNSQLGLSDAIGDAACGLTNCTDPDGGLFNTLGNAVGDLACGVTNCTDPNGGLLNPLSSHTEYWNR
jgi:hypothetical protein